jgi:ferredoxin
MMYRISIDRDLCSGYGICETLAPDVFELGDDGIAIVREGVSEDEAVLRACNDCPMGAISFVQVEAA